MPPVIVHHMAAPHDRFMPNSLEAIRACLSSGAAFIEVDVTALASDDYLLVHDPVLENETTGSGAVGQTHVSALEGIVYLGRDSAPTDLPVARLSQVVQAMVEHGGSTRIQLDFKNVLPFADNEPLERLIRIIEPLGSRVIVSSGADWQLRRMKKLAPWLDVGLDVHYYIDLRDPAEAVDPRVPPYREGAYGYWDDHPLATTRLYSVTDYLSDRCAALAGIVPGCSTFYINYHMVLRGLDEGFNWAQVCREHNIRLDIWTLDIRDDQSREAARRLLAAGVDLFTTNTPEELAAVLR